jgi:MFS family permease
MKPKFFYGYIIVLVAFFIMLVMWGAIYSFGIFFKPLLTEFGWTRAETSGAYSLFMVLHGLVYILTGRLNDKFGPRIVLAVSGLFLGLGYLLMSQVSAIWQLYLFYGVVIAMGMGGTVPLMSTVARWFTRRRGLVTGIVMSGSGLGTMIMPPMASWLISSYGWPVSYLVIGIITLVLVILAAQFLRRDPTQIGQLPYGADKVKGEGLNLEVGGFSLGAAIRTRQFWMLAVMFLFWAFCVQVIMVHIVPHAIDTGISPASAAGILTIIGGLGIAGRVIMGGSGDRIGNRLALIISFMLIVLALSWVVAAEGMWMLCLFAIIFGFAYGGSVALQSPLVADLFGLRAHGAILGATAFASSIGGAIGPLLAGYIFDITSSYYLAFLVSVTISIVGLVLVSLLTPISQVRR